MERRRSIDEVTMGREARSGDWSSLNDDELIHRIETLDGTHEADRWLLDVVSSDRHFFVRQLAAKKVRDSNLLREHWDDRHIGQILVRTLSRSEDVAYLERLRDHSRHIDVRKAAEAQLKIIATRKKKE